MKNKSKKKSKKKVIIIFFILFGGLLFFSMFAFLTINSENSMLSDQSLDGTLSTEDNNKLKDEFTKKLEEINQYNTFYDSGERIGKMVDYYNTDQGLKLRWNFVLAYIKYLQIEDENYKSDVDDVRKKITQALDDFKPKFIYKKDKIIIEKTYPVKTNETDPATGKITTTTTMKTDTSEEAINLLIHAENVQGTYNITYKSITNEVKDGDTTIKTTMPVISSFNQVDAQYDNLKKILKAKKVEDVETTAEDIVTIATTYFNQDDSSGIINGDGTFGGTGEVFTGSQKDFINRIGTAAVKLYPKYHVLPSITIAQAIIESSWGTTGLTKRANNLFGIQANNWNGPYITMQTTEYCNTQTMAKFRAYASWDESIEDHCKFLVENSRYAEAGFFRATNYIQAAQALQDAGYATQEDANGNKIYAKTLDNCVRSYNLDEWDAKVK